MPLYTVEFSHKQEEEIFFKYICKMKMRYGNNFDYKIDEILKEHYSKYKKAQWDKLRGFLKVNE